jgi:hypothetical protein
LRRTPWRPALSILGTWQIVEAVPAPWVKPEEQAALAAAGRRMLNTEVTFAPGSVNSKWKAFELQEQGAVRHQFDRGRRAVPGQSAGAESRRPRRRGWAFPRATFQASTCAA